MGLPVFLERAARPGSAPTLRVCVAGREYLRVWPSARIVACSPAALLCVYVRSEQTNKNAPG